MLDGRQRPGQKPVHAGFTGALSASEGCTKCPDGFRSSLIGRFIEYSLVLERFRMDQMLSAECLSEGEGL